MPRLGATCGYKACEGCGATGDEFKLEAAGAPFKALFPWQLGLGGPNGKNGPRFTERQAHDEVPVVALCCERRFNTIAPDMVADGLERFGAASHHHVERQLATLRARSNA